MTPRPGSLFGALALWVVIGTVAAAVTDPAAMKVQTLTNSLLESMRAGASLSMSERYRKLEPVVQQVFALPLVTRLSVGPDWAKFSPDEQKAVISAFTRFTTANYAYNFRNFNGEKFQIDDNVVNRGEEKLVRTQIIPAHDTPVSLVYRMREVESNWRIIDVYSNGVSNLALRRSDFAGAIASGGAPALVAYLNKASDDLMK